MNTNQLADLVAERDALTDRIARAIDKATKRSLAAQKAHLTRKINAAQTTALAPTPTATELAVDANTPMSPSQILKETRDMLDEYGFGGWGVNLSNVMTRCYGLADFGKREIRIAAKVAALNPAAETRDTIAHEVAHVIAGIKAGHGWEWKKACRVTGARPVRCHKAATVERPRRYRAVCDGCGQAVGGRKVKPAAGSQYFHRSPHCPAGSRNVIRWVDVGA